jgi:hypothetical protein
MCKLLCRGIGAPIWGLIYVYSPVDFLRKPISKPDTKMLPEKKVHSKYTGGDTF